jgi:lysophospholipase L1-like esterase
VSRASRAVIGLVVGAGLLLVGTPAHAAGSAYVALGDSYSSGNGTGGYLEDGTSCRRSVYSYPSLIASSKGYTLNLRACSGATTADVAGLQLSALGTRTAYVTVTVGGNDAGFTGVVTTCATPAWLSNCNGAIDSARTVITTRLPARLRALYGAIRTRAPYARVVVAGYPHVFNGEDCNALTWFSPTEQARLNATTDLLNSRIASAAGAAGFAFADPTTAFRGHAVCARAAWVNGLSRPVGDSYHPNLLGHSSGYSPLVAARLTGAAVSVSAGAVRRAVASADRLAARQRPYAARDRTVEPERFLLPDLTSAESRAAAARAGVDVRSRASVDAADRRFDAAQRRQLAVRQLAGRQLAGRQLA